jgi:[ribosomal protein S5]-alanine N-acetyltransferase
MSDEFEIRPPGISTPRLHLRALSVDDAHAVHGYAFDPEVARFLPWRPHSSELFAAGLIDMITQPQFLNWAITKPPSDRTIGMVFLHSFSKQHQKAELAFNLAQAQWHQGLATEAASAVLHFAFHRLGLNRIEATCIPENLPSRKVLEKLGMSFEGRMRKSNHRYDGFQDMDLFALLSPLPAELSPKARSKSD